MIRLKPKRRIQVSNGAALLAAMLLVASSFIAVSENDPDQQNRSMQSAATMSKDDGSRVEESSARGKPSLIRLLFGNS
jgi:hypothetical protein